MAQQSNGHVFESCLGEDVSVSTTDGALRNPGNNLQCGVLMCRGGKSSSRSRDGKPGYAFSTPCHFYSWAPVGLNTLSESGSAGVHRKVWLGFITNGFIMAKFSS